MSRNLVPDNLRGEVTANSRADELSAMPENPNPPVDLAQGASRNQTRGDSLSPLAGRGSG
jgi:hypothetical protein